jgi:hypothetical protein
VGPWGAASSPRCSQGGSTSMGSTQPELFRVRGFTQPRRRTHDDYGGIAARAVYVGSLRRGLLGSVVRGPGGQLSPPRGSVGGHQNSSAGAPCTRGCAPSPPCTAVARPSGLRRQLEVPQGAAWVRRARRPSFPPPPDPGQPVAAHSYMYARVRALTPVHRGGSAERSKAPAEGTSRRCLGPSCAAPQLSAATGSWAAGGSTQSNVRAGARPHPRAPRWLGRAV